MADYPPTPSFGMSSSRPIPPYQEASQYDMNEYGDPVQRDDRPFLEYDKVQNNAAFQYNRNIPGFSAAAVASGIPPLPIYQDHNPPSYSYTPDAFGLGARFESSVDQNRYSNASNRSLQLPPTVPRAQDHKLHSSNNSVAQVVEEGELSEGEYEEVGIDADPKVMPGFGKRERHESHRDEYGEEPEDPWIGSLTDKYGRSLYPSRRRSDSYSPEAYLAYEDEYEPPEEFEHGQSRARQTINQSGSSRVDTMKSSRPVLGESTTNVLTHPDAMSQPGVSMNSPTTKSVRDARKEAQNAILNLLPLKVRFHDFLEEGIDEEVVRRQFENLGMPQAPAHISHHTPGDIGLTDVSDPTQSLVSRVDFPTKSSNVSNSQVPREDQDRLAKPKSTLNHLASVESATSTLTKSSDRELTNTVGEERKDRIARLLAEKIKKLPSPLVRTDSLINSVSPEAASSTKPTSNAQSAAKADKERLLRQKMEALQKSREQRAQKAAAKATPTVLATTANMNLHGPVQPIPEVSSAKPPTMNQQSLKPSPMKPTSSLQIGNSKQAMPSIPGLFLAAGASTPQSSATDSHTPTAMQNGNQRKRPVASDFDGPPSTDTSYKRPFGQSRNDQPLVIDVSDEDSEDGHISEMEIDHQTANPVHPQNVRNTSKSRTRDLPPLSDFPPRKPFHAPSSAMSTPPAPQLTTKSHVSRPEDLQRKEMEIQEMKRKIAEAERRKKAKQSMSGSQTPRSNDSTSSPAKYGNVVSISDKVEASIQIERLVDDASRQIDQHQQKLAEAHAMEQAQADELKRREAERRRLRRAKIASDLPIVDAEVEKGQKKLTDLRAEMAEIEAAVQQRLDEKRRLAEEMEKLSQEADEQLQAQKDRLRELTLEETDRSKVPPLPTSGPVADNHPVSKPTTPSQISGTNDAVLSNIQPTPIPDVQRSPLSEIINNVAITASSVPLPNAVQAHNMAAAQGAEISSQMSGSRDVVDGRKDSPTHISSDQTLEVVLQNASAQAEAESQALVGRVGSDVDMEDSYALQPKGLAPASRESPTGENQQENGFVGSVDEQPNVGDGESDHYEPPEATPPKGDAPISFGSPPFSPAPPEVVPAISRADIQVNTTPTTAENLTLKAYPDDFQGLLPPPAQTNQVLLTTLNLGILGQLTGKQNGSGLENRTTLFTPYESPLKHFHAYRFHPAFEQEVQGGFKSLTYSNNIKHDQELCRYELAGVCNDASCEFQHFKSMGLADDAILVELGNSSFYSEEDKPRFVAGLRTVLQGLRAKKTKDFQIIASEIAAYRTRFLGDKSKVLVLDGISV